MSEFLHKASDAIEGAGDAVDAPEVEVQSGEQSGIFPLSVILLLGLSISMVSKGAFSHYSGHVSTDMKLLPWLLLCSCGGGIGYLFFNSIYSESGSVAEACSIIMRLPPVVFGIIFLAAIIPGIEIYLHPQLNV